LLVIQISVCVCTYLRPELLRTLLHSLLAQTVEDFTVEIVVVDNDANRSAEHTVTEFRLNSPATKVVYIVEAKQGISFARNSAVHAANGNYIAFIDDDELAVPIWLKSLLDVARRSNCDAVLGPVIPNFPDGSPLWVSQSGFFDRPRHPTGSPVPVEEGRTGNALVKSKWLASAEPFDPQYAFTGGEDYDFFRRMVAAGGTLLWANEAVVSETVPMERQRLSWMLERALRGATGFWRAQWAGRPMIKPFALGIVGALAGIILTLAGAVSIIISKGLAVRLWILAAKGFGRSLALTEFRIESYRSRKGQI